MEKRLITTISILLSCIILFCQAQEQSSDFDFGKIEKNKYINSFFHFSLSFPDGWIVQLKENAGSILKSSEMNTIYLLSAYQYEPDSTEEFNPNFIVFAEDLKNKPEISKGCEYLNHVQNTLKQTNSNYNDIDSVFECRNLNTKDFYLLNASYTNGEFHIMQESYSTIQNGYSIYVVISYMTEEQKKILSRVISSILFED